MSRKWLWFMPILRRSVIKELLFNDDRINLPPRGGPTLPDHGQLVTGGHHHTTLAQLLIITRNGNANHGEAANNTMVKFCSRAHGKITFRAKTETW